MKHKDICREYEFNNIQETQDKLYKKNGFKYWDKSDKILFLWIVIPLVLIWLSTVLKIISWII